MGLTNSKDKIIQKIIQLSQSGPRALSDSDIQEIMMNSQFQEDELLKL